MTDITTATIDQKVQAALKDWRVSPFKRAHIALDLIKDHIRSEHGDLPDPLPIPMEWEHRVQGLAEAEPRRIYVRPAIVVESPVVDYTVDEYAEWDAAEHAAVDAEIEAERASEGDHDEISKELMKNTFDALYAGDEDAAQQHIDDLWDRQ
jgi:hypothetical protein